MWSLVYELQHEARKLREARRVASDMLLFIHQSPHGIEVISILFLEASGTLNKQKHFTSEDGPDKYV